jgi:hypothetical protein
VVQTGPLAPHVKSTLTEQEALLVVAEPVKTQEHVAIELACVPTDWNATV